MSGLTLVTRFVSRLFRADVPADERISSEELRLIIEQGGEQGIPEAEEEQMIHAVIELGDQRIHEVLVPRIAMVTLSADATINDAIDSSVAEGHSRIPVYEGSIDEIIGIVYAKDLLPFLKANAPEPPPLRSLLRPPVFVPESMTVDDLLHEFQRRKVHIAVVLDEYGGTAGLVTIEDLLEEIVGEISDEYDREEPRVETLDDETLRVNPRLAVDELGELVGRELPDGEWDSVGGLFVGTLGRVPVEGDKVGLPGLELEVEKMRGRRIARVLVRRLGDEGSEPEK